MIHTVFVANHNAVFLVTGANVRNTDELNLRSKTVYLGPGNKDSFSSIEDFDCGTGWKYR